MKFKEFLEQFKDLDPEMEVYKWNHEDYFIEPLDPNYDTISFRYVENDKICTNNYSIEINELNTNKKVLIIPGSFCY